MIGEDPQLRELQERLSFGWPQARQFLKSRYVTWGLPILVIVNMVTLIVAVTIHDPMTAALVAASGAPISMLLSWIALRGRLPGKLPDRYILAATRSGAVHIRESWDGLRKQRLDTSSVSICGCTLEQGHDLRKKVKPTKLAVGMCPLCREEYAQRCAPPAGIAWDMPRY